MILAEILDKKRPIKKARRPEIIIVTIIIVKLFKEIVPRISFIAAELPVLVLLIA